MTSLISAKAISNKSNKTNKDVHQLNDSTLKSERIWFLRQDPRWSNLLLARGQSILEKGQKKILEPVSVVWDQISEIWPQKANLGTLPFPTTWVGNVAVVDEISCVSMWHLFHADRREITFAVQSLPWVPAFCPLTENIMAVKTAFTKALMTKPFDQASLSSCSTTCVHWRSR